MSNTVYTKNSKIKIKPLTLSPTLKTNEIVKRLSAIYERELEFLQGNVPSQVSLKYFGL